jgi:CCR4-NOT transcription complex subunit 6
VLTYNVLAEPYAAPDRYFYCPPWALEWDYRKHGILKEILTHDCDIICLQEVEAGQFVGFFQPEMAKAGYSGVISTKSRARTMEDWSAVDGCAVFYKRSKFALVEEHIIEYQSIAMGRHKEFTEDPEAFSRLITKDNVAIAVILQVKDSGGTS